MEDPTGRDARRDHAAADDRKRDGSAMKHAGIGIQFAASILLFLYAGQWLDRRLGTSPWLLMAGVFVGGGAAFYSMYRSLMADQARDEAERLRRKGEK